MNTDDDAWFAAVCRVLQVPDVASDPRFVRPDRDCPGWNEQRKAMNPGGPAFPALHALLQKRLATYTAAQVKTIVTKLDRAGVPVNWS